MYIFLRLLLLKALSQIVWILFQRIRVFSASLLKALLNE